MDLVDKYIVVIDDDRSVLSLISEALIASGARVKTYTSAKVFLADAGSEVPDCIILDLKMPGMDGFSACDIFKKRERFAAVPIIMLSGIKTGEEDKVTGLDLGADDYMLKPFSVEELKARIRSVLRRQGGFCDEKLLRIGNDIEIDLIKHGVKVKGQEIELTPAEFKLLECLATRKGQVFSRERLLEYLWGDEKVVVRRTIDVHIRHLREKLGETSKYIKNVRGFGYKIEEV